MDVPAGPDVAGYDRSASAEVIARALQQPGGANLVTGSLSVVPGAVVTERRSGLFRSRPAGVQLAQWRYEATPADRLTAAHIVGGIVLAEDTLSAAVAGPHVAAALGMHLVEFGPSILPDVVSVLEGLAVASDSCTG